VPSMIFYFVGGFGRICWFASTTTDHCSGGDRTERGSAQSAIRAASPVGSEAEVRGSIPLRFTTVLYSEYNISEHIAKLEFIIRIIDG
jgi:hypothetical protein